ncbi:glycosyltransferase, partial [Pantoea sp. GbtcB22]|uniref:glycosyltransferase family 4 protein n=1 Tax=Pantoea sp. GbtcB22 TaxID=2824767 RepID=UPI001C2FADA5
MPIAETRPQPEGAAKKSPLAAAVRVPAFWGLVVAFAGYGLAFSAMSFHLIPLLDDRGAERVITNSQMVKNEIIDFYNYRRDRIDVIRNGVPL